MSRNLSQRAIQIMNEIMKRIPGSRAMFVGGCVRDRIMGHEPKDYDIEVFGATYKQLKEVLERLSRPCYRDARAVGKDFGIVKFQTEDGELDFAIPRRENRVGVKHTDFECEFDPNISSAEALARRDFTMNSMYETVDGYVLDPWGGQTAIREGILKATTDAYMEDPLRVLRGMQFASRFGMCMDRKTIAMSIKVRTGFASISRERVWMEWRKWALGSYLSSGLLLLQNVGWLGAFPELKKLMGCPQDSVWHPEGDAWEHTMLVTDEAGRLAKEENMNEEDTLLLVFAALLHDVGKPMVTTITNGKFTSPGHAFEGSLVAEDFLSSIGAPRWLIDHVKSLVKEHMIHTSIKTPSKRIIQRLSRRVEPATIPMLRQLVRADYGGRPPLPPQDPLMGWEELAKEYKVDVGKPDRILMGRHLLETGMAPGIEIGVILDAAYEAQLDGVFNDLDGARRWASKNALEVMSGLA